MEPPCGGPSQRHRSQLTPERRTNLRATAEIKGRAAPGHATPALQSGQWSNLRPELRVWATVIQQTSRREAAIDINHITMTLHAATTEKAAYFRLSGLSTTI